MIKKYWVGILVAVLFSAALYMIYKKLKYEIDKDKLSALKKKKKQVLASIETAKSTLKQAKSTIKKIKSLKDQIEAVSFGIKALKAKFDKINVILDEMVIKSPVNGYIVDKIANEGEVIGAGMSIYTAINPDELYLKMFVDTLDNAKVKIGDVGVIFLDGLPAVGVISIDGKNIPKSLKELPEI